MTRILAAIGVFTLTIGGIALFSALVWLTLQAAFALREAGWPSGVAFLPWAVAISVMPAVIYLVDTQKTDGPGAGDGDE